MAHGKCIGVWIAICTVIVTITGCTTPLGETTYRSMRDDGLLGEWTLVDPDPEETPDPDQTAIRFRVEAGERGIVVVESGRVDPPFAPQDDVRYTVYIDWPLSEDDETNEHSIELVGRVVESKRLHFFTFQRSAVQTGWPMDMFETPVQLTWRFQRNGNRLHVWRHRTPLVWVPIDMAGDLAFAPPTKENDEKEMPARLAQHLDDVIEFYADSPEDAWILVGVAQRLDEK